LRGLRNPSFVANLKFGWGAKTTKLKVLPKVAVSILLFSPFHMPWPSATWDCIARNIRRSILLASLSKLIPFAREISVPHGCQSRACATAQGLNFTLSRDEGGCALLLRIPKILGHGTVALLLRLSKIVASQSTGISKVKNFQAISELTSASIAIRNPL